MLGTNLIRKQIQVQTLKATLENFQRKLVEQKIESNEEIQKIIELPTRKKKKGYHTGRNYDQECERMRDIKKLVNTKVYVRDFSGAEIRCIKDYMKPSFKRKSRSFCPDYWNK